MIASKQGSSIFVFWIHAFFLLAFAALSLLNHYYFRSAGLDYGLANQALYQYAHGKAAVSTQLLSWKDVPYLSCHLSFWTFLFSPLYYVFGSYTLLIMQMLAIVFGGMGLIRLCKEFSLSVWIQVPVLIQLYTSIFIWAALGFDFHENVIGACFFPWIVYAYIKDRKWILILSFLAILISKENMAIWAGFIAIGLPLIQKPARRSAWILPISLFLLSIMYFLLVSLLIMPALSPDGSFQQLSRYSYFGKNLSEIVGYMLSHPIKMLQLFYQSHVQPDADEGLKHEFLKVLLFSGGLALLRKPQFLWMALPILMQKLWNVQIAFWGISYHYQAELALVISVAIVYWLKDIKTARMQWIVLAIMVLGTLAISVRKMNHRFSDFHPERENLFSNEHYAAPFSVRTVHEKLKEIPADAIVCAQSNLMPHVAFRDRIYHFPYLRDAQYLLILQPQFNGYPLEPPMANHFMDSLRQSGHWQEDSSAFPLRVFRKF